MHDLYGFGGHAWPTPVHLYELGHINLKTGGDVLPMDQHSRQAAVSPFGACYYGMDFLRIIWIMKVKSTNRSISKSTGVLEQQWGTFFSFFPKSVTGRTSGSLYCEIIILFILTIP